MSVCVCVWRKNKIPNFDYYYYYYYYYFILILTTSNSNVDSNS